MSDADFWDAEIWQVINRITAWGEKREMQEKAALRRTSILGSWLLSPYAQKHKQIKPSTLLPAVWDDEKVVKRALTAEERKQRFAKHDAIAKKMFGNG